MLNDSKSNSNQKDTLYRYGRQMILPAIGVMGQEELSGAKLLLVGAGGIGSSAAMYLATAGINLTIMDHDNVDQSNLHRYCTFSSSSQPLIRWIGKLSMITTIRE